MRNRKRSKNARNVHYMQKRTKYFILSFLFVTTFTFTFIIYYDVDKTIFIRENVKTILFE